MEVSVSNQLYVFGVMILCGACAGMIFDVFRASRKTFGAGMLTTSVGDILFWLIISVGLFFVIFTVNSGEIRWFEAIGIVLGSIIYFLTLSRLFTKLLGCILGMILKIFLSILKIILTPFVFLYKMIKRPLLWAGRKTGRLLKRSGKRTAGLFDNIKRNFKVFRRAVKKS